MRFCPFHGCERVNHAVRILGKESYNKNIVNNPLVHIRQKEKMTVEIKVYVNNIKRNKLRLYFKVIIRQNETQYFTYSI